MALLPTNVITRGGFTAAFLTTAVGGDTFNPGEDVFLHVKNTTGSPVVVTVANPGNVRGVAFTNYTISIPATTGDKEFGPFPPSLFAGSTGVAAITYAAGGAGVTIQVKKYPTS